MTFARYIGDPAGYRLDTTLDELAHTDLSKPHWITAKRGITAHTVLIDLSKAYLIEEAQ